MIQLLKRTSSVLFLVCLVAAAALAQTAATAIEFPQVRQDAFDKVWNTINEKHYDPTFNGVDWKAVRETYLPRAKAAGSDEDFHNVLRQMLAELKLSHFNIFPPPPSVVAENETGGIVGIELKWIGGAPVVFRVEPGSPGPYPLIDEHALAARLSYFLWSTMPDDELTRLAGRGELRANLAAQVDRMLADRRSDQFIRQFVGQWLQVRDIDSVPINAFAVLSRDQPRDPEAERRRDRFRELRRKAPEELSDEDRAELEQIVALLHRLREPELRRERHEVRVTAQQQVINARLGTFDEWKLQL